MNKIFNHSRKHLVLTSIGALGALTISSLPIVPFLMSSFSETDEIMSTQVSEVQILLLVQNSSQELSLLTEDVIHRLSQITKRSYNFILEQAHDDEILALFDGKATRTAVRNSLKRLDISDPQTPELEPVSSSENLLISMVQRCEDHVIKAKREKVTLHCFIITGGSKSPVILSKVLDISKNISKNANPEFRLHLVGLHPDNRLAFSNSFYPLSPPENEIVQVDFSGTSDSEWLEQIQALK